MNPKSPNYQNFEQNVKNVIRLLVVYQCTKLQVDSSIFDPEMGSCCLQNHTNL